jgi:hypothetical protein
MARLSAPPSDLQIEDLDGRTSQPGPGRRPALKPGRLLAIVAVAVAVLAVAFPLRAQLNRSEAERLEHRWQVMAALDAVRSSDLTALNQAGAPGDSAKVHSTVGALYDEQAADLVSLTKSLRGDVIVDTALRRVRTAMTKALGLEAADLSNAAHLWRTAPAGTVPSYLDRRPTTAAAIDTANGLLAAQAARFSLPTQRDTEIPHFPIADTTLASFRRFLDTATGVTLLADTSTGLQTIDIDHSRISPATIAGLPAGFEDLVVARPDVLVFQHPAPDGRQSTFYLAPARLPSTAVSIGTGQQIVAGADPSTFWLVGSDDSVVEVDRAGTRLAGPISVPPNRFVVGATSTGLVLQPHLQSDQSLESEPIEIWDALGDRSERSITSTGLGVLATDTRTVAWVSGKGAIHVTDSFTGVDRVVDTTGYIPVLVGAAFSPDGSRLAVTMSSADGSHTDPAVIDVSSGVTDVGTSVDFPPDQPGPITWTAGGDRIFVPMSAVTPADQVLTYRPGGEAPHYLRLPDTDHTDVYSVVPITTR